MAETSAYEEYWGELITGEFVKVSQILSMPMLYPSQQTQRDEGDGKTSSFMLLKPFHIQFDLRHQRQPPPNPTTLRNALTDRLERYKAEIRANAQSSSLASALPTFMRAMGDTELSYYLPSRADGVNDM